MERVVIIGSGNMAEALAKVIGASRYELVQICARNRVRGEAIARLVRCEFTDHPAQLAVADIYLLAVSDRAIAKMSAAFDFGEAVVAHLGGSVALDELDGRSPNRGVFYPLQTFSAGCNIELSDVPIFVEGSNEYTLSVLKQVAEALSTNVHVVSSEQRMRIHLAAVFASNFVNHMLVIGQGLLMENGLSPELIKPLIREVVAKALNAPLAVEVQTGPARRNDFRTKHKHIELLRDHPQWQSIYKNISLDIWETSKKI